MDRSKRGDHADSLELCRHAAALGANEEQYRLPFELNPNPMWIFDEATLRFLAVNDAAVKLYGWPRKEFLRMTIKDVRPPEEVPKLVLKSGRQRSSRAAFVGEWRHWRKDGTVFDVEVTISRLQFQGRDACLTLVNEITERKRAEAALRESEQRLKADLQATKRQRVELEKEILAAGERVRRQIGHDLHDDLCQQLTSIEYLARALECRLGANSQVEAGRVREITSLIRQAIAYTRELSHTMSPMDLAADGLPGALKDLAAQTRRLFHIDCRFQGDSSITVVDSTAQTNLYRVAQEATQNAIRHGKARLIHIGLMTRGGDIVLRVQDDGVGLPPKPHEQKGFGLRIMDYRAKALGGSLAVQKPKSGGTTLVCSIPKALITRAAQPNL